MPPGKLFKPFSTPPYLRSRHLKVCANLAREEVFHLAVAWNRRRLPAESDGPLNGETFITRTFLSFFCLFSIRYRHRPPNPRTRSSILKVGTGRAYPGSPCPHPLEPPCPLCVKSKQTAVTPKNPPAPLLSQDRKSTRLNSSHLGI